MIRFCPKCQSERELQEIFCEGTVDGEPCGWNLANQPFRPRGGGAAAPVPAPLPGRQCAEGHPVDAGDLLCPTCGEFLDEEPVYVPRDNSEVTVVDGWELDRRLPSNSRVRERFIAVRGEGGRQAVLTLYAEGSEPDPTVYEVLRTLPRDHVPEIIATGRWNDRAYEVAEELTGGTLAELGGLGNGSETLPRIVYEVGRALHGFAEVGLRHRDLRPGAILVRSRDPLDLVVTGFGSARLSEFDLDLVSPLEVTRYTAPEAALGGVAAASDWWSLGMILLEQVTCGACFEGVNEQAFLIHVLTNGAPIPPDLEPRAHLLLCGLLARERRERWGWSEVERWLAGEALTAPASALGAVRAAPAGPSLSLGGAEHSGPAAFALAAADPARWDEARGLLLRGVVATWAETAGLDRKVVAGIRHVAQLHDLDEDFRLALALKFLNAAMPLTWRGEIVSPGWLLDHPAEGYALITGPAPELLSRMDAEQWLSRLSARVSSVRTRAADLEVPLNEEELRVHLLSTSRTRLAAVWEERRHFLADTDHPALLSILERRTLTEEDLILLLSADISAFRTADTILREASEEAGREGLSFDPTEAAARLRQSRREIYYDIDRRTEGFARCNVARIDEWVDRFRLERRLPVARALLVLAVPESRWRVPPGQQYVQTLLDFFQKRVVVAVQRGPLTRMTIGKTTARVDLAALGTELKPAESILNLLLERTDKALDLDPAAFQRADTVERRTRALYSHATLYRRDTGIDGLYLGFPFLVMQDGRAGTRPKVAPVLLWPVRLRPEVGAQGRVSLAFDRDREEVRLNPAFETLLGSEATKRWREAMDQVLGQGSLTVRTVMDGLGMLAEPRGRTLVPLPERELRAGPVPGELVCAAVLFHLAYTGQAVAEDLRAMRGRPPGGTALESALRLNGAPTRETLTAVPELDRYFTAASDPSQEAAVFEARRAPGLVVEGPPGTGKSQTIVNMVADAIGRKRSLLIVCQKQAALDVVHKRLEAEGIGHRVMMITDVNRDREPVVRAIREQVEALRASTAFPGSSWWQRREQAAARIEALEGELDRHHARVHEPDELTGLSYRALLGELMRLEAATPAPVDAPALRALVGALGPGEVARLEETCAPLAPFWLPARYEESPLAALTLFHPDPATIGELRDAFAGFVRAEGCRAAVVESTPLAYDAAAPGALAAWFREHGAAFVDLEADARRRLARWLPLLPVGAEGGRAEALLAELAAVEAGIAQTRASTAATKTRHVVIETADAALCDWQSLAEDVAAPAGFLAFLSPSRWSRRRRLKATFARHGLLDAIHDLRAFIAEAAGELQRRPWRRRLAAAWAELDLEATPVEHWPYARLADLAQALVRDLSAARELALRLRICPERDRAVVAVRAATAGAWNDFAERTRQTLARADSRAASRTALTALLPWFEAGWSAARESDISADAATGSTLALILEAFPTLEAYQRFRLRAGALDAAALDVFRVLRRVAPLLQRVDAAALEDVVRRTLAREARLGWKARMERDHPALLLEAGELEGRVRSLAAADEEMRRANRDLLVRGIDPARLGTPAQWEDITRLRGQRARRLREFLEMGAVVGLMELRPVWLMNPDVASRVLPLKPGLFDTVIYDEASQIPVEYALPTLYRGGVMVVSGDEKQMPPTSFFTSRVENDEADVFDPDDADEAASDEARAEVAETWNRREIKDCPDLLQLARAVLRVATLQIHYRSAYRELIWYSNAAFYAGQLSVPVRHPDQEVRRVRPIEVIRADGVYVDQCNPGEAEAVADCVARLWSVPSALRKTLGVVTFNRKQADLIELVLEVRAQRDPAFRAALAEERERTAEGEDMGFFVKNVENVQGDERDVIVFSSTFGRNAQGTFRRSFGVLGQAGGERRLNVAVTRAKERVILVTSIPIPMISDLLTTHRAPASPRDYLQGYFEYARLVSEGELDGARALAGRLSGARTRERRSGVGETDGFHEAVGEFVRGRGWEPVPVFDPGAFGLDFAVVNPDTGLYGIGIECDAPRHALLSGARAREMWRPSVLSRSIATVHRVSSRGWYHDPARERERLMVALHNALNGRSVEG